MESVGAMAVLDRIMKSIRENRENSQGIDHQNQSMMEQETRIQQSSYKCSLCRDTTWVERDGRFSRCTCYESNNTKKLWEKAGIRQQQLKELTFSSFVPHNETTNRAKNLSAKYVKNFLVNKNTRRNSIAIVGQVGSGKTHLTIAIARNLLNKNIQVIYMPYRDTVTRIKQNMLDEEFYQRELNKFKRAEVLLIDDLFKGKISETDINIFFEIINHRYINNLPVILSSELTMDMLLDKDEAIASRLIEMTKDYIIEIRGKENNYRLR